MEKADKLTQESCERCPGCGRRDLLAILQAHNERNVWTVACECGWTGPVGQGPRPAVDLWNRRIRLPAGLHRKVVPFGERRRVTVAQIEPHLRTIIAIDSAREGYILVGTQPPNEPLPEIGVSVVIEFVPGGPNGGFWHIVAE